MFKMFSITTLLGLSTISAYAQSSAPIQAEVPFAFMVQDTTLPAGNYQFTYNSSAQRLLIRGLGQSSEGVFATAVPVTASESSNVSTRLIFKCYDNTCYLEQVSQGGISGNQGLKVPQGVEERRMAFLPPAVPITIPAK
ncbi:MAG: hypothetical protein JO138_03095 [Acidobacteriaceae bacterium]|nr:hypothetical protein [Acidobacteriaceae bacterium]